MVLLRPDLKTVAGGRQEPLSRPAFRSSFLDKGSTWDCPQALQMVAPEEETTRFRTLGKEGTPSLLLPQPAFLRCWICIPPFLITCGNCLLIFCSYYEPLHWVDLLQSLMKEVLNKSLRTKESNCFGINSKGVIRTMILENYKWTNDLK